MSAYTDAIAKQAASKARKAKRAAKGLFQRKSVKKKSKSLSRLKKELWEKLRFVVYNQSDRCMVCGSGEPPVACHIVPASDSAATKFFLPNIYRGCRSCNDAERRRRGQWVKRHEEIFGTEYVSALYEMSKTTFQIKRHWILEQTERMENLNRSL